MQLMDQELTSLIARGVRDGFLTFDEVNSYLPDEDVNPEKLNKLLLEVERHNIQLIEVADKKTVPAVRTPEPNVAEMRPAASEPQNAADDQTSTAPATEMPLGNEAGLKWLTYISPFIEKAAEPDGHKYTLSPY